LLAEVAVTLFNHGKGGESGSHMSMVMNICSCVF